MNPGIERFREDIRANINLHRNVNQEIEKRLLMARAQLTKDTLVLFRQKEILR